MDQGDAGERRADMKSNLLERLHDPLQLKICVISAVLIVGYVGIYMPYDEDIVKTTRKLKDSKKLVDTANKIEQLQEQYDKFEKRLQKNVDSKEWVQYVLDGIRQLPVKLCKLDCRAPKQLGPYQVVVLQIEMEATFFNIDKFLRWIESNERLMRADDIRIAPARSNKEAMYMQVTILGLAG